ncbi:phosphate ABC transporter substrate-binding protein PstS family protein [bacterium]|nr:phosphate ABC transporter substrate-binding protein PstS family protein [bacterium]
MLLKTMLATATFLAVALSPVAAQDKVKINISGSDTMNLLTQRLAETYSKKHANVEISVRGGGSGTGIADLLNGLVDIAQASRKMKEKEIATAKENGYDPAEYVVALDGIAIAVHESNPVKSLTIGQLRALYSGAVKNWSEIDPNLPSAPVVLFSRESNCGTYDFFKEHVMKDATFAPNTSYLAATAAVANSVTKEPNAIGFGGVSYFVRPEGLRVVPISVDKDSPAVNPIDVVHHHVNLAVIQDGSYPISRPLQYYTPEEASGEVKSFLDWIISDEGQAIVLREEYIPLGNSAPTSESKAQ